MVTTHAGAGLTRLVVFAPHRRLDLAVPDHLPLAGLIAGLLQNAGDHLADAGLAHEGWVLRRADGTPLDAALSLAAQRVGDGEALHLVPRRMDWPELMYDDVVDAVALAARRRGRRWSGATTRTTGLVAGGAALLVGLAQLVSRPTWTVAAPLALAAVVVLLLGGIVMSRALADADAGAVVAGMAMPFAFAAGILLLEPVDGSSGLGAAHLLTASALLAVTALAGHLGVADHSRVFVGGVTAGVAGVVGSAVAFVTDRPVAAAALVTGAALLVSPAMPAVSVRIGHIPLPELPRTAEDLIRDAPRPDRRSIDAATARADEALTGMLLGLAAVTIACAAVLVHSGQTMAVALAGVVSVAHLLRARFYVGVRHRVPLLVAGGFGLAALGLAAAEVALPTALAAAAVALGAGLYYRDRAPSPRLGRLADVLDVVLTLAVLPLVAGVLGVFTFMRGLGG